jgi:hypothetical protein
VYDQTQGSGAVFFLLFPDKTLIDNRYIMSTLCDGVGKDFKRDCSEGYSCVHRCIIASMFRSFFGVYSFFQPNWQDPSLKKKMKEEEEEEEDGILSLLLETNTINTHA